jgi:hypothetical protein
MPVRTSALQTKQNVDHAIVHADRIVRILTEAHKQISRLAERAAEDSVRSADPVAVLGHKPPHRLIHTVNPLK